MGDVNVLNLKAGERLKVHCKHCTTDMKDSICDIISVDRKETNRLAACTSSAASGTVSAKPLQYANKNLRSNLNSCLRWWTNRPCTLLQCFLYTLEM